MMKPLNQFKILSKTFVYTILFLANLSFGTERQSIAELLTQQQNQDFLKSDKVLIQLGFEDFSAQISNTLNSGQDISEISKAALKRNAEYLQTFNASRNLANLIYSILKNTNSKSDFDRKLKIVHKILIQQLSPFPLLTLEPISEESISKVKKLTVEEGMKLKREIYKVRAQERFFKEKLNLIKAYLSLLNPTEEVRKLAIAWLDQTINDAIIDTYTIEKRQQNRILGRATVVALVYLFREEQMNSLESDLKLLLRKNNLFIENYIRAYYVHYTRENDIRGTQLMSGDVALEYSHGQEAFFTSLLIQPKSKNDKNIAKIHKLTNSVFDSYKFLDDKKYYEILDKKDTYRELTPKEQSLYNDFWDPRYANGFSHVGIVQVKTEPISDISVAWIWDIYPEKDKLGVVRILSPEGFSYPEKMLKFAILRYSPEKLLKSFKLQFSSRGYLKQIWEGYSSFYGQYKDGNWGPAYDKDEFYTWTTKVNFDQVLKWSKTNPEHANVWYNDEILPRVFGRIKDYLVSAEAKVFADGLVSAKDMLYCSQLINIAFLEAANLDLQNTKDGVWETLKYLSSSINDILNINIKHRLVSPNGLVWQQDIFGNLYSTFLNRNRVEEQKRKKQPTVAESYTEQLLDSNSDKIDEEKLLELKKDSVELDFES